MIKLTRMAVLAAIVLTVPSGVADDIEPFPDDWFFYGSERPEQLRGLEGKKAKDFAAAEWRGDEASLADLKGKVVVLDFWATWCGPCMAAIPKNVAMVDKYEKDGLAFIGIHDSNSGWDKVDAVINDKSINYPVALDDSGKSTKAYNLRFWPTYVLIDRNGIIRAAGMAPDKVEGAVKILLEEPYEGMPVKGEAKAGAFPDEWFFGADKRPSWLRAAEGKPLKKLDVSAWMDDDIKDEAWRKRVLVVQFVKPEFALSVKQLESLEPIARKYARQGVVFAAVCDANADWDAMQQKAEELELTIPLALDATNDKGTGATAQALGVRFSQPLAVVDRAGVVRAVGLRPQHLEGVLNTLLAERLPPAKTETTGLD